MAKRNFLNNNNEVITEFETAEGTVRTEETIQEAPEELVAELVAELAAEVEETTSEAAAETVTETKNTLLTKRVYELEPRVYNIELRLTETGDRIKTELQIIPTSRNGNLVVANYIEQHFTMKGRYNGFTVVSIN